MDGTLLVHFGPLTAYRNWILDGTRGLQIAVIVAAVVLLGVLGSAVDILQDTISVLPTALVAWAALMFAVYTFYLVVRTSIPIRGRD